MQTGEGGLTGYGLDLPLGQIAGIKPYPNELKRLTSLFGEKAKKGRVIRFADWGD